MAFVINSIEGNRQRLDGGAMFGNVPHRGVVEWIAPDERHRIPLACRAFLIHDTDEDRRILLEAGIGCFFEPRLTDRFGVQERDHRAARRARPSAAWPPEQIDVVVLSHLHFDHAGGLLTPWQREGRARAGLPAGAVHRRAARPGSEPTRPHPRDRASFIPRAARAARAERAARAGRGRAVAPRRCLQLHPSPTATPPACC